jgi:hypothetical protein
LGPITQVLENQKAFPGIDHRRMVREKIKTEKGCEPKNTGSLSKLKTARTIHSLKHVTHGRLLVYESLRQ